MTDFDLLESPLQGTNLIEAAAGTGKTYAIAGLYVRLVVEQGLTSGEILVVTYTVAATEELKTRIRNNLREAAAAFAAGESDDPFLSGLVRKFQEAAERVQVRNRLIEALRDFDEAAIFTIHGFCQRMLLENAFESGALFDSRIITDEQEIKREIVQDFWRVHLHECPPEIAGHLLEVLKDPDNLLQLSKRAASNPDVLIVPEIDRPPSVEAIREAHTRFENAFARLKAVWPEGRDEVREKLSDPGLNGRSYGKSVEGLMTLMDGLVASGGASFSLPGGFDKLTASKISASARKGHAPPDHPVFGICQAVRDEADALKALLDDYVLFLKAELFRTIRRELPARKLRKNFLFYDDLLVRLRSALDGEGGRALAGAIRRQYRAALIDEFQDTDPIQYAIFQVVFGDAASVLFLIGDPKQAIYSFRGADIFAYMKAATHVGARFSLGKNWRADPALIEAVNAVFSNADNPFVYEDIGFSNAEAGEKTERDVFTTGTDSEAPLQLWFVPSTSDKPVAKGEARRRIARAVAAEVSSLLHLGRAGKAGIAGRPLREADIAILVRTNREVGIIQEALRSLGITSVASSVGNIFDAPEAEEMERIMAAVAAPKDERLIRTALVTDLLGQSGEDLDRLSADEKAWGVWLDRFSGYHDLWQRKGFIRMFRHLLMERQVRSRLLAFGDGERRLTNVLHLSEILHRESIEQKLTMTGLLKWFAEQRRPEAARLDEHQLRLESDENAVRIVTIHKSKGLEYPVVFCPFSWSGSDVKQPPFLFHDERKEQVLTCDLGSAELDDHRRLALREALAENMRLLYVALTRAKHRCYFVWGRFNQAETSAPAWLLHPGPAGTADGLVDSMKARFAALDDNAMVGDLSKIAARAGGALTVTCMSEGEGEPFFRPTAENGALDCRDFSGAIDRSWRVASFSSLASGSAHVVELPDRDAPYGEEEGLPDGSAGSPEAVNIFTFPKGALAGTFFHDLLEHLDYPDLSDEVLRKTVREKMLLYGFDSRWEDAVSGLIRNTLECPLHSNDGPITLSAVDRKNHLHELGFFFPLKPLSPQGLVRLFASRSDSGAVQDFSVHMERLHFSPAKGFMRGFMDLVFRHDGRYYLVDWKSNHLGDRPESYAREALAEAMHRNFYTLQYYLYAVALHQYLKLRIPDYRYASHFGGVYYLFLRGMDRTAGTATGVYYDRPSEERIETLREGLIEE